MASSKKDTVVIGIDPGKSGSVCLLLPATNQVAFKDTTIAPHELYQWFRLVDYRYTLAVVMVEKVRAIRGAASNTTFEFGRSYERCRYIPELLQMSMDDVTPQKWHKFIGMNVPAHLKGEANKNKRPPWIKKEVSRLAIQLYPKADLFGPKGGLLDGRSDALMIAHYAARTINHA